MNEKREIARLDFDVSSLVTSAGEAKTAMEELKAEQSRLTKEIKSGNAEAGAEYVKNAVKLKQLTTTYNDSVKAITSQNKALDDNADKERLVQMATDKNISSINEARANVALLTRLRNDLNASTAEGVAEIKRLNDAIDSNNEFIEENADAYLKLKLNIGNYSDSIREAFEDVNIFNGGLGGFISRSQEAGGAGELLKTSFTGITAGIGGMIKASLAFIATPLGAVLAIIAVTVGVLVGAFEFMVSSMQKTEAGSNKLALISAKLSGAFSTLGKLLKPLAEFLFNVFSKALDTVISIAETGIEIFTSLARAMGFDGVADAVDDVTEAMKNNVVQALALEKLKQKAEKLDRESLTLQLKYQLVAEKLRQERDDENKSLEERLIANGALGRVLVEQSNEELKAKKALLAVAIQEQVVNGKTSENERARLEAIREVYDVEERIAGQESEQLANQNALRKEFADKEKERQEKALADATKKQKEALDYFIAQGNRRAKTLEAQINYENELFKRQSEFLKFQLKTRQISRKEYDTALLNQTIDNELKIQDLYKNFASAELDLFLQTNQSKIDSETELSRALIDEDNKRLESVRYNKLKQLELEKETNEEIINLKRQNNEALTIADFEYLTAKNILDNEFKTAQLANEKALDDADTQRRQEQKAIENELRLVEAETEQEEALIAEQIRYEEELARYDEQFLQKKLTAEEYDRFVNALDKKSAEIKRANAIANASTELGAMQSVSDAIGETFGQSKELATAQAIMSGGQAVMSILAGQISGNPLIDSIIKGVLIGTTVIQTGKQVQKINSAKKPSSPRFEKGGVQMIGGKRHIAGGVDFTGTDGTRFNAESGEVVGIMNRNASRQFMSFNDAFLNESTSSSFSESGGVISQGISTDADLSPIASMISEAVSNLPAPVVYVDDINLGQQRTAQVLNNGDLS